MSEGVGQVERWLAWRYLATRQREGFVSFIAIFSLIGVALGVATLIVVLSVMGGFREQLVGRIIGMNGHVVITARDGMLQADSDLLATLRQVPQARAVRLTLERQALVEANGQTRGALLRGVRLEDLTSRDIVTRNVVHGGLGSFDTRRGVVLGERLRQALNVRVGDTIGLVTHRMNATGTIAPRYADYEVLASFLSKRYEFDSGLVFLPLQMLQDDLGYDMRTVTSIDLELPDPAAAPGVAAAIRRTLSRADLTISDWLGLNARFVGALQVERVMMFIILTLIVVVAAMNVIASFTMLVRVKRGSIAILRTMGAAPGSVVRAFFMAAAAVGLAGTAIGGALGLVICANMPAIGRFLSSLTGQGGGSAEVDFITSMPVRVRAVEVLSVVAVAVLLSLAAAAYPAGAVRGSNLWKGCVMSDSGVALSLRAVERTFVQGDRRLEVLRGVALDLRPGEIVALVGQSGSGKSTLLHIAGLLERPDGGEVVMDGRSAGPLNDRDRTALRRRFLGFVYQYHHLLPEFSALENVMLPQMLNGLSRREARRRAGELLAMVQLSERMDHRPGRLSGGEQQRVAIARAVANAPRVLLADEPTGNLDGATAEVVFRQLLALTRETGMAALIATHNPELAARMDRTVLLKNGVLGA